MGVSDAPDIEEATSGRGSNGGKKTKRRRNGGRLAATPVTSDREIDLHEPMGDTGPRTRNKSLRKLLAGMRALDAGDFRVRLEPNGDPLMAEVVEVFNRVAERNQQLADELRRVSFAVGREGNMRERAHMPSSGSWAASVEAVNSMITDLVQPTTEVSRVLRAVAEGDLSQKVELEIEGKTVQGEFFRIGSTVNRMVDQLRAFASEVTRVAKEVGTEGVLGGQAHVPGVAIRACPRSNHRRTGAFHGMRRSSGFCASRRRGHRSQKSQAIRQSAGRANPESQL